MNKRVNWYDDVRGKTGDRKTDPEMCQWSMSYRWRIRSTHTTLHLNDQQLLTPLLPAHLPSLLSPLELLPPPCLAAFKAHTRPAEDVPLHGLVGAFPRDSVDDIVAKWTLRRYTIHHRRW